MRDAEVTVVVPLFNKKKQIGRCLDSILSQTHPAAEIIVVDDGSNDGSAAYVRNNYGQSVRLVCQENGGVSSARNTGIVNATSDFVAFIDADDTWSVHFLAEIAALIYEFPDAELFATAYQFCISDQVYKDPKYAPCKEYLRCELSDYFVLATRGDLPFNASSACVTRQLIHRIGGFPVGEAMGEDQDLWARAALRSRIAYSQRKLAFYHLDADNRACANQIPKAECPFSVRLTATANDLASKRSSASQTQAQQINEYTAGHLLDLAARNVRAGDPQAALNLLADKRTKAFGLRRMYWQIKALVDLNRLQST